MAALLSLILAAGMAVGGPTEGRVNTPRVLLWTLALPADMAELQARKAEVGRLMGLYAFGYQHWAVHQLRSELISDHLIFKLLWADPGQGASELILIVPRAAASGTEERMQLIPVRYTAEALADPSLNLHNVAIFNRMMADEPHFQVTGADDWLDLAQVYLELTGDLPQIVTPQRLRITPHGVPPKVTLAPDGGATVEFAEVDFTDAAGSSRLVQWRFQFDRTGHLLALSRK